MAELHAQKRAFQPPTMWDESPLRVLFRKYQWNRAGVWLLHAPWIILVCIAVYAYMPWGLWMNAWGLLVTLSFLHPPVVIFSAASAVFVHHGCLRNTFSMEEMYMTGIRPREFLDQLRFQTYRTFFTGYLCFAGLVLIPLHVLYIFHFLTGEYATVYRLVFLGCFHLIMPWFLPALVYWVYTGHILRGKSRWTAISTAALRATFAVFFSLFLIAIGSIILIAGPIALSGYWLYIIAAARNRAEAHLPGFWRTHGVWKDE